MTRTGVFDLGGRVAAVVGGTGVLGGAICHGLGEAGAEAAGIRAIAVPVDAAQPAQDRETG